MINQAILVGRLTKDPELRYTNEGIPFCFLTLAVSRDFRNQKGQIDTDFITVTLWRKSAENVAQHCQKGTVIGIKGRVQTRNYENEQKQKVYATEIAVDRIKFLSRTIAVHS